jgi:hypothetical protein
MIGLVKPLGLEERWGARVIDVDCSTALTESEYAVELSFNPPSVSITIFEVHQWTTRESTNQRQTTSSVRVVYPDGFAIFIAYILIDDGSTR